MTKNKVDYDSVICIVIITMVIVGLLVVPLFLKVYEYLSNK
jgi:hypothetical protein